jgi:hypothetical protein
MSKLAERIDHPYAWAVQIVKLKQTTSQVSSFGRRKGETGNLRYRFTP